MTRTEFVAAGEAAIARFTDELRQLRERTEAARAALVAASASASTGSHDVTVRVDAGGTITALDLEPAALRRRPEDLSRAVLATIRAARMQALDDAEQRVTAIVGADSKAVALLRRQRAELSEPVSEDDPGWGRRGD